MNRPGYLSGFMPLVPKRLSGLGNTEVTDAELSIIGRCPVPDMPCLDALGNDLWQKVAHLSPAQKQVIGRCPNLNAPCLFPPGDPNGVDLWRVARNSPETDVTESLTVSDIIAPKAPVVPKKVVMEEAAPLNCGPVKIEKDGKCVYRPCPTGQVRKGANCEYPPCPENNRCKRPPPQNAKCRVPGYGYKNLICKTKRIKDKCITDWYCPTGADVRMGKAGGVALIPAKPKAKPAPKPAPKSLKGLAEVSKQRWIIGAMILAIASGLAYKYLG